MSEIHSQEVLEPQLPSTRLQGACVSCRQRKVKCDKRNPCSSCLKAGIRCRGNVPRARKRHGRALSEHQAECHELSPPLREDSIKVQPKRTTVRNLSDQIEIEKADGILKTPEIATYSESSEARGKRIVPCEGFQCRESTYSQRDADGNSCTTTCFHDAGILFGHPPHKPLTSAHPKPEQIFKLWQTYLNNVNPLTKIIHTPTVQRLIVFSIGDLESVSRSTETLMFVIYLSAVTSMKEDECLAVMGKSKGSQLVQLATSTQQSLINADFLETMDVTVLQAFTLFLISMRYRYHPRTLSCLSGIGIRIGQRIGIHHENTLKEFSIFDAEMGRRLWWQLGMLDYRSCQRAGIPVELQVKNIRRPLNINDTDLVPTMKEPPVEHKGVSEMLFCSVQSELGEFSRQINGAVIDKNRALNDLVVLLEQKYLHHCDPAVPFHLIVLIMSRSTVYHMKFAANHHCQHNQDNDTCTTLSDPEREMLFSVGLNIIENDNLAHSTSRIQQFLWFFNNHSLFDALVFLLRELRSRVSGEQVEQAWIQVTKAYSLHPEMITYGNKPLYLKIGNLAIAAWENRVGEMKGSEGLDETSQPSFISALLAQRCAQLGHQKGLSSSNTVSNDGRSRRVRENV